MLGEYRVYGRSGGGAERRVAGGVGWPKGYLFIRVGNFFNLFFISAPRAFSVVMTLSYH